MDFKLIVMKRNPVQQRMIVGFDVWAQEPALNPIAGTGAAT